MPLSNQDVDQLENILFDEAWADDTLDYFGLHGAVCASVTGPKKLSNQQLIELVFADAAPKLNDDQKVHIFTCCQQIASELAQHLHEGTTIVLPHENEEAFEDCLESWCAGYMEAFFINEKAWFNKDEEIAAELLLPYMALSGLFDNDEFAQIHANDNLMSQFEQLVAEQLTDIYLYYHSD